MFTEPKTFIDELVISIEPVTFPLIFKVSLVIFTDPSIFINSPVENCPYVEFE